MATATDFSSPDYWGKRFETETSFEWLVPTEVLLPFIEDHIPAPRRVSDVNTYTNTNTNAFPSIDIDIDAGEDEDADDAHTLNVLHFGSGTSSLGREVQLYLSTSTSTETETETTSLRRTRKRNEVVVSSPALTATDGYVNANAEAKAEVGPSDYMTKKTKMKKDARKHTHAYSYGQVQVHDADYVPVPIPVPSLSTSTSADFSTGPDIDIIETRPNVDHIPFLLMDVLSLHSLRACQQIPRGGYDLLIDKSTADAISCGPTNADSEPNSDSNQNPNPNPHADLGSNSSSEMSTVIAGCPYADPVQKLAWNLAHITRQGGRWISVSYSSTRYDFIESQQTRPQPQPETQPQGQDVLPLASIPTASSISTSTSTSTSISQASVAEGATNPDAAQPSFPASASANPCLPVHSFGWKMVHKSMVATTTILGGRLVKETIRGKVVERRVYEPETGVWAYVLERV
ncbi:hypothetical protein I316_07050 [Kwoniella heveanensis BCC8398]|uniref:Uncharacterized protein n=1 Tax=Kwoniella heveanensis BCC8398 TaxID=1296120 RepID=A0A1B9GJJ1_9TREE|nr:hypothetical protein I316_07050 [Kwoniella heveanensis BCC8398]